MNIWQEPWRLIADKYQNHIKYTSMRHQYAIDDRDLKEKVTYRAFSFSTVSYALHMLFVQGYICGSSIVLNKPNENTHECMDVNNKVLSSTFENSFRHGMCVLCTISNITHM
jgi:hypothetical protein